MSYPQKPLTYDGYLIHDQVRYPLGVFDGAGDLARRVATLRDEGGALVLNEAGLTTYIPFPNISRFLLVPRP